MADIVYGTAFERSPGYVLARVTGAGGENITQATLSSIAWESWLIPVPLDRQQGKWTQEFIDLDAADTEQIATGTLVVADSIFDTLQTGNGWDSAENDGEEAEEIGYNFRGLVPATAFPQQLLATYPKAQWQRIDFTFTPVIGEPFTRSFELEVKPVLGGRAPE